MQGRVLLHAAVFAAVCVVLNGAGVSEDAVVPEQPALVTTAAHTKDIDSNDEDEGGFEDDAPEDGDLRGPAAEVEDEKEHPDNWIYRNHDPAPDSYDSDDAYVEPEDSEDAGQYKDLPGSANRRRVGGGFQSYHKDIDVKGWKEGDMQDPIFNHEKLAPITAADKDDPQDRDQHDILKTGKEEKEMKEATHIVQGHMEYGSGGHQHLVVDKPVEGLDVPVPAVEPLE